MVIKIEGSEWKTFTFKMLTIADHELVGEHIRQHYIRDEPLNITFGYTDEAFQYLKLRIGIFLKQNLSFAAFDKETGRLAAVLLNIHHSKHVDLGIPAPPPANLVRRFLTQISAACDLFQHYNVSQYGEIFIASVGRDFRGQGLAKEMYRRSMSLFQNEGDSVIMCLVSSPFTRKICSALGFAELKSWQFSEARDHDGTSLLKNSNLEGTLVLTALGL